MGYGFRGEAIRVHSFLYVLVAYLLVCLFAYLLMLLIY